MGQKKLLRFEAIKSFPNVLQYPEGMAGNWKSFFHNDHPITVELACGKGEYTVALARMYPERNFIGIDLKGNRLYIGAKTCLEQSISNAAFVRSQIDKLGNYFSREEVSEIWITFPDPQLRKSKLRKRLTHPRFLRLYQHCLVPQGMIHLKTDSPDLYDFTKQVIQLYDLVLHEETADLYASQEIVPELKIKTHYEGLNISQSNKIYYLRFSLPMSPLPDKDEQLHDLVKGYENIG
ncbi:MAG: tRNA (guanosine(46)-N7)-methyltransferase TrmB [Williamsia sp.]|nr:tRNA (guanosine(46)-N7)-methyltransferase TrmB [Williamsia sp.]